MEFFLKMIWYVYTFVVCLTLVLAVGFSEMFVSFRSLKIELVPVDCVILESQLDAVSK